MAASEEKMVFVLQGGVALGAYQAGAYEALAEAGHMPSWVAGISIGSVNAAIIASIHRRGASSDCAPSGNASRVG